jgi:membrane protein required for colicin V production
MPAVDWIFLVVLLVSLLLGAWRGFVYEVLTLAAWAAAFVVAQGLSPAVAQRLPMQGASDVMRYAPSFALIFIVTVMIGGLLATLFKKMVVKVGLRPIDRMLGAAFGWLRGVFVLLLVTTLVAMTPFKSSLAWQESMGVGLSLKAIKALKPALPREMGKYLPTFI